MEIRPVSVEFHESFIALILLMWQDIYGEREERVSWGRERSFIPMKLIQLAYLVFYLGNHVMKLCIETGLKIMNELNCQYIYYHN